MQERVLYEINAILRTARATHYEVCLVMHLQRPNKYSCLLFFKTKTLDIRSSFLSFVHDMNKKNTKHWYLTALSNVIGLAIKYHVVGCVPFCRCMI